MKIFTPRPSTSQTNTSSARSNAPELALDTCFLLPSETHQRHLLVRAFLTIAPSREYSLGAGDDVFIRCALPGEPLLEVRSPQVLQIIRTIVDFNNMFLFETDLLILQHNLYIYGSYTPWYPNLSWLNNTVAEG